MNGLKFTKFQLANPKINLHLMARLRTRSFLVCCFVAFLCCGSAVFSKII